MSINNTSTSSFSGHEPSDEALCAMARGGDRRAEEILVTRYSRLVRRLARPFFLARGYQVVLEQQVERRGVLLTNFVMEKRVREAR